VLHGRYPYANLFEQNCVERITADPTHGDNGPFNTFFRNKVTQSKVLTLANADSSNIVANQGVTSVDIPWLIKLGWTINGYDFRQSSNVFDVYFKYYPNSGDGDLTGETRYSHEEWANFVVNHSDEEVNEVASKSWWNTRSLYRETKPAFVGNDYSWPSYGPPVNLDGILPVIEIEPGIPAQERFETPDKTYLPDPVERSTSSAEPFSVKIQGPSRLNNGQTGIFQATTYRAHNGFLNYRWYRIFRSILPDTSIQAKGIARPFSDDWSELKKFRGDKSIIYNSGSDFSLKVIVSDSQNSSATAFHSVRVDKEETDDSGIPEKLTLSNNFPNPSNPSTMIRFGLPKSQSVKLVVYSLAGKKMKTLVNSSMPAGYYTIEWKGKNENNSQVSSGIYIYRLVTPEKAITKRLTVMK